MDEQKEKEQRELEEKAKNFMEEYSTLKKKYGLDLAIVNEIIIVKADDKN